MDETAYRNAKGEINRQPCVFERALLARTAVCELAMAHQIAERETFACSQSAAHRECQQLAELLRQKSAFALGITDTQRILPHAMVMKIQRGLSKFAYSNVPVDGVAGASTRDAIRNFEKAYRLPETGAPNERVLKKLKEIGAL